MTTRLGLGNGMGVGHGSRGWRPTELASKLGVWMHPSGVLDASGWAATRGGVVLTSAALPTAGTRNGMRVIVCNGTSQFVKAAFTRAQTTETWCAGAFTGATQAGNAAMFSGNTTSGALLRLTTGVDALRITAGTGVDFTATADVADRWAVWGARFAGATSKAWENTTEVASGNANTGAPAGLSLGAHGSGASFCRCEIGEVITTVGALTDAERLQLTAYLMTRWAITA